jgi:hypothetical protein
MSRSLIVMSVTHHRQNPLECTLLFGYRVSRLILCKIGRFHGGHYKEFHRLEHRNPVRTPQETHYFSAAVAAG